MAKWRDADNEQLTDLVATGKSAREIGDVMRRSRNAIIGQCHRMGLQLTGIHPNKREPKLPEVIVPVEPLKIPFMELKIHHCRSVEGTGKDGLATFCGHPKYGASSYCLHHHVLYERPMPVPVKSKRAA